MRPVMDFWFFFGSTYSYLTVARMDDIADRYGVSVTWRPFNLRPILQDAGLPKGPFAPYPIKSAYMWRDLERRARKYGIPYQKPTQFPVELDLLATRVGLIGFKDGWGKEFTKAAFADNFVHGKVLGTEENVRSQVARVGQDPGSVFKRAHSDEISELLARETAEIRALGAFGAPHFVVGGELFWGDDRLEDALACAVAAAKPAEAHAHAAGAPTRKRSFGWLFGNAG